MATRATLTFAGGVGTGFNHARLETLTARLRALQQRRLPVRSPPPDRLSPRRRVGPSRAALRRRDRRVHQRRFRPPRQLHRADLNRRTPRPPARLTRHVRPPRCRSELDADDPLGRWRDEFVIARPRPDLPRRQLARTHTDVERVDGGPPSGRGASGPATSSRRGGTTVARPDADASVTNWPRSRRPARRGRRPRIDDRRAVPAGQRRARPASAAVARRGDRGRRPRLPDRPLRRRRASPACDGGEVRHGLDDLDGVDVVVRSMVDYRTAEVADVAAETARAAAVGCDDGVGPVARGRGARRRPARRSASSSRSAARTSSSTAGRARRRSSYVADPCTTGSSSRSGDGSARPTSSPWSDRSTPRPGVGRMLQRHATGARTDRRPRAGSA